MLPIAGADGISVYDALEDQLGLKVGIRKVPMPVIAVVSVNRNPTPNLPGISLVSPPIPTRFEVASIKLSGSESTEARMRRPAGGCVGLRGFTLRRLIKFAWDFQDMDVRDNDELLIGGPRSLNAPRLDILSQAPVAGVENMPTEN